jgi:signal transduction histidine kinase
MFQSATLKLTGWYLLFLMVISILFSVTVYDLSSHEISAGFIRVQSNLLGGNPTPSPSTAPMFRRGDFRGEASQASSNILIDLLYVNAIILVGGGFGSYALARRTIRPIEEAHEAQSRFTSDASHELRTPLAAMKTEIEVALRDKNATTTDLRETLDSNLEEVEKLARLSEMLLNLSRLEHDKLSREKIDLYKLTVSVISMFNQPASRIAITAHQHPKVMANEPAITELISILVDNALKYSPKKSLVSIRISSNPRQVIFEITNTGPGIGPKVLPYIFDRFFRADSSRTGNEKKGYGLGLALASKIVSLHHGELTATSAIDHATTFVVSLPIIRQTQAKNQ